MDKYAIVVPRQMEMSLKEVEGFEVFLGKIRQFKIDKLGRRLRTGAPDPITAMYEKNKKQNIAMAGVILNTIDVYSNYSSTSVESCTIDIWKNGSLKKQVKLYDEKKIDIHNNPFLAIKYKGEEYIKEKYDLAEMMDALEKEVEVLSEEIYKAILEEKKEIENKRLENRALNEMENQNHTPPIDDNEPPKKKVSKIEFE